MLCCSGKILGKKDNNLSILKTSFRKGSLKGMYLVLAITPPELR